MKLGDICNKIGSGATPRGGKESYKDSGTPIIRSQNVLDWSFSSDGLAYLDDDQAFALSNVEVKPRDVLLNITGDSVARACIVPNEFTPARVNQHVSILRTNSRSNPVFLLAWLQTNKSLLLSLASSGATRNALTKTMLEKLDVNLPPIDVQERIAGIVLSVQSKIETNAKLNGYLAEQCEGIAEHQTGDVVALASLCGLVSERVDCRETDIATYVSTESLLPAKMGKQTASSLPQAGKVTVYKAGDTLVSNIRPYFKKIWYADRAGTCSGDVLVFRANQPEHAGYLYSCLRQDRFFDYVMKGAKGTKMPRGDKKQMLTYEIVNSPSAAAIGAIQTALEQISIANKENDSLAALRDALLPKLMSGEIDVSEVDLTQLNSHLT